MFGKIMPHRHQFPFKKRKLTESYQTQTSDLIANDLYKELYTDMVLIGL